MNLFEQIALAVQAVWHTTRVLLRPALWVPWLVLGATELLVLAVLWGFAHPALSWFMAPLLLREGGEDLLRYPNLLRALPDLFARADLLIGAVAGSLAIGAATLLFAEQFRGERPRPRAALATTARRSGALIAAQLPFNLIVILLSTVAGAWLMRLGASAMTRRVLNVALVSGSVVVQSLFLYIAALVVLERRGPWSALKALPRTWARGFWAALLLGFVLLGLLLPLHALTDRVGTLVDRGDPDLVGWLVAVDVLVSLVVWFLLAGSATMVYLTSMAEHDTDAVR